MLASVLPRAMYIRGAWAVSIIVIGTAHLSFLCWLIVPAIAQGEYKLRFYTSGFT